MKSACIGCGRASWGVRELGWLAVGLAALLAVPRGAVADYVRNPAQAGTYTIHQPNLERATATQGVATVGNSRLATSYKYSNAYMVFDLRGITEEITELTLSGTVADLRPNLDGMSFASSLTAAHLNLKVFAVSTPAAQLGQAVNFPGTEDILPIYSDLGSGDQYAQVLVSNGFDPTPYMPEGFSISLAPTIFEIKLGTQAVLDARAALAAGGSGLFAIGFSGSGSSAGMLPWDTVTGNIQAALRVTTAGPSVPEPPALVSGLLGLGLIVGVVARRRLRALA